MATSSSPADAPLIGVIGSARIQEGDGRWREAYDLGCALGAEGWRVLTGGYGGLMEAAARGAHEHGATVIGLPMRGWTRLTPSRYCGELRWAADYSERLRELLSCDVIVGLAGGVGTLTEAAVAWSALQTEAGAGRLVLVGAHWDRLLDVVAAELVVGPEDLALVETAADVAGAVRAVRRLLAAGPSPEPRPRG